jgi:biotin transport system substrate-specific component
MAKMNQQQNVEHKKSAERKAPRRQNVERLKRNILISLFAVIITICSRITIPSAVPFTLQSLGVFLTFDILGGKLGLVSYLLYLSMGLLGIPVSASGQTGVAMLLGVTGGYLIGWLLCGLLVWLFEALLGGRLSTRNLRSVAILIGTVVCYAVGTLWFVVVYSQMHGAIGLWTALCSCVFPFVIFDFLKLLLADRIALLLKRAIKI